MCICFTLFLPYDYIMDSQMSIMELFSDGTWLTVISFNHQRWLSSEEKDLIDIGVQTTWVLKAFGGYRTIEVMMHNYIQEDRTCGK